MSTISIQLNDTITAPFDIAVNMTPPLKEIECIWVWDHYFSTVLNRISEEDESSRLINTLTEWATAFIKNMRLSFDDVLKNDVLQLSQDFKVQSTLDSQVEEILIEATSLEGCWPNVHAKISETISAQQLRDSVLALAQFFLNTNPYFYRELPLHILAMKKYYQDELHYRVDESIKQAPAFAFDTMLQFHKTMSENKK